MYFTPTHRLTAQSDGETIRTSLNNKSDHILSITLSIENWPEQHFHIISDVWPRDHHHYHHHRHQISDLTWPDPTYTGQSLASEGALSSVLSTRCPPSVFLVCILDFNWWRETDKELKISILLKFWVQLRTIFTRQKLNISLEKIRIIVELSLTTQYSYLQQSYLYDVTGDWENWIKFQINNTQIETLICQPWKGWNKIPSPLTPLTSPLCLG